MLKGVPFAAIEKHITDPNAPLDQLVIAGFWADSALVLPPQRAGQPDSADVLCYVRHIGRYTIGSYNYLTHLWSTDLGRYETRLVSHWAYVPSVNVKPAESHSQPR